MTPVPYTLYHNYFSVCSIMLRYTIAVRGQGKDGYEMSVQEKVIDIQKKREQLSEFYLLNVNPKGQVPAITSPVLDHPMADSKEITKYLATLFPSLAPERVKDQVFDTIDQLHGINFFSLTFTNNKGYPNTTIDMAEQLMRDPAISEDYRKALQYKIDVFIQAKRDALQTHNVEVAVEQARTFLTTVEQILLANNRTTGGWLFGLEHPSAADAHLIPFLARLHDVGRGELVPQALKTYLAMAKSTQEWREVMGDRSTMFPHTT